MSCRLADVALVAHAAILETLPSRCARNPRRRISDRGTIVCGRRRRLMTTEKLNAARLAWSS
jgi:hypothetical protein